MTTENGEAETIPTDTNELSKRWNKKGREYYGEYSARLVKMYDGEEVDLDMDDPRSEALGEAVLAAAIELAADGNSQRIRELFDPAYSPMFSRIKENKTSPTFVTMLSPDELLVRCGAPWNDGGKTLHLRGDNVAHVDDVVAMCRSRSRDFLLLARSAGLEVRDARGGLDGTAVGKLPWPDFTIFRPRGAPAVLDWEPPDDGRFLVEQLAISDDGMRAVVSCYRQGILLASRHKDEPDWTLLWPDAREPFNPDEDHDIRAGDMTHVAMSRDGRRLAFGCQDAGHFLAEIDSAGDPAWYARVGHLSEYPHYACFSDDGRYTALNSCHFYNGATVSFDWEGNRGVDLDAYDEHEQAPCIDGGLRVYAACWLDRGVVESVAGKDAKSQGAFLLAGSGIMRLCGAKGGVGFVQGFGSSGADIDFCAETRRIALASYSGMVHVYDSDQEEHEGRIDGMKPRRELYRWLLWDSLPAPLRW